MTKVTSGDRLTSGDHFFQRKVTSGDGLTSGDQIRHQTLFRHQKLLGHQKLNPSPDVTISFGDTWTRTMSSHESS